MQNANEELTRLAKDRMASDSLSYEDAFLAVSHENPILAMRARKVAIACSRNKEGILAASEELYLKAKTRARERGIEYRAALSEIYFENPELARAYQREIGREDSD
jgi:hypothetical protein